MCFTVLLQSRDHSLSYNSLLNWHVSGYSFWYSAFVECSSGLFRKRNLICFSHYYTSFLGKQRFLSLYRRAYMHDKGRSLGRLFKRSSQPIIVVVFQLLSRRNMCILSFAEAIVCVYPVGGCCQCTKLATATYANGSSTSRLLTRVEGCSAPAPEPSRAMYSPIQKSNESKKSNIVNAIHTFYIPIYCVNSKPPRWRNW